MHHHVTAVIVTYRPRGAWEERLRATLAEVDALVIVDNTSGPETHARLERFMQEEPKSAVIYNDTNAGLATAQNQGIRLALQQGTDWVLLLDDDSRPQPGMVQTMLAGWEQLPEKDRTALMAPYIQETKLAQDASYILQTPGVWFERVRFGDCPMLTPVWAVIASGSLIRAGILKKEGLMRESWFIDYLDTEYCLRLTTRGYKIAVVKDAVLEHQLGKKTEHRIGKKKIIASNHNPRRRYTIYRNRIWMWRLYWRQATSYIVYDILAAGYDLIRIALFEKQKGVKLMQAGRGIMAGFGKMN